MVNLSKLRYWKRCLRLLIDSAGRKGREKVEGKRKKRKKGGEEWWRTRRKDRVPRVDSIRDERAGFVFTRRRACHAQEVRAVYPKGRYQTLQNFSFLSLAPSLVHRSFGRSARKLSRGGKPTPLVHWLSRLINRYAILNFPKNYPTIPSFVSDFPTHWFSIPCDFSDFLFFVEQSDVFNLYFSFPSFNFKNISWILQ